MGSRLHIHVSETDPKEEYEVILSQASQDGLLKIWGIIENARLPHVVYGWYGCRIRGRRVERNQSFWTTGLGVNYLY